MSEGEIRKIAPQPWMIAPATRAVIAALADAGIAARFVGGCVRDALLGRPIADVDIATPARPEAIITALEKARIKAVPTGLRHGTVTAVADARVGAGGHVAGKLVGVAMDGKVIRNTIAPGHPEGSEIKLFSALLHSEAVVIAQLRIPPGTNEITQVEALLGDTPAPS